MRPISALLLVLLVGACTKSVQPARAFRVQSRAELIGGQRALAEIGDYEVSNGLIHAIVQDVGTSRGFGAFGGSLIDIDLVRDGKSNTTAAPVGNDYFTEMFPAFFLLAIEPSKVQVLKDGSVSCTEAGFSSADTWCADGAAIIRVSGGGGEFISIIKSLNESLNLVPDATLEYSVDYILEPGKQYLKIITTIRNTDTRDAEYGAVIPFGFVTLLGEGQRLFLPNEAGFDVRFHLDEVYKRPSQLEALPGEIVSMVTTEGKGVSYAVSAAPKGAAYMSSHKEYYEPYGAKNDSILIPIASSSFLGTFWGRPPQSKHTDGSGDFNGVPAGKSYSYTGFVSVGTGDVASVQKVAYEIQDDASGKKPTPYATLAGRVREKGTQVPLVGVSVVVQDDHGKYASQAHTISEGRYVTYVLPGRYHAYAVDTARSVVMSEGYVEAKLDGPAEIDLEMDPPAMLHVTVRDDRGRALPAKISVEGIYDHQGPELPRQFGLYNLAVGEHFRNSDLEPDGPDKNTRRYLETSFYAPLGEAGRPIRPNLPGESYRVFASRGVEYSLESTDVILEANKTANVELTLTQEAPTPGWASGDFHVHSINSVDSDFALADRVTSYAVEGVDLVTSTDHNYVTDFKPTIEGLQLSDWLHSSIGLELTTLEMGHFNGYPLRVDPAQVNHGSFAWFHRPPADLFAQLRGLGGEVTPGGPNEGNAIVQVNHPRDTVLGYFSEFNMGSYTTEPYQAGSFSIDQSPLPDGGIGPYDPRQFSLDFDALEVFNAKRDMLLFSYRVPKGGVVGPEPSAYGPCGAGKTADCVPAEGQMTLVTQKTLDGGTIENPAFPGALDDWYSLLAHGHHITATGNSDSHSPNAEAGLPRTYMRVGPSADGSMKGLSEDACMEAIRKGRVIVTNGPFIEAWVNGKEIGDEAVAPTGEIAVRVRVQAAKWIDVAGVRIMRGGRDAISPVVLADIPVTATGVVERIDETRTFTGIPDNSFIVVVAYGNANMWPVFTPYEIASFQISDAVAAVAGPLAASFGPAKWGKYQPPTTNTVRPYGFTNPIWVSYTAHQALTAPKRALPLSASEPFRPRALADLRKLFGAFHSDPQ